MNGVVAAIQAGFSRGIIELRHSMSQLFNYVFFPALAIGIMFALRDLEMEGARFSLGGHAIPGIMAMNLLYTGVMGLASALMMERNDGTLLRAKATPNGVIGYLVGKFVSQTAMTLVTLVVVVALATVLFDEVGLADVNAVMTLAWLVPLGILATLPFGAVLGSVLPHPRDLSFVSLLLMGLIAVSGVFYPLALHPEWTETTGQVFPLYWLGLGMRSAMLPDEMVVAEIGETWRSWTTATVLGMWAVVGIVLAITVLRRTARRQSGAKIRSTRAVTATSHRG